MDLGLLNALNRISEKLGDLNIFGDQKNYYCFVHKTASQAISNNTETLVTFPAKENDAEDIFSIATNKWTCPVSGHYFILSNITYEPNLSGYRRVNIVKNGTEKICSNMVIAANLGFLLCSVSGTFYIQKGETIEITSTQTSGVNLNIMFEKYVTNFSVAKINSYISPTPTETNQKARVYRNAAFTTVAGVWTKIPFDSKEYDPENLFSITNSRLTISESGTYAISSRYSQNNPSNAITLIACYKNGVLVTMGSEARVAGYFGVNLTDFLYLNKGDYLEVFYYTSSISNFDVNSSKCYFSIHKLSN